MKESHLNAIYIVTNSANTVLYTGVTRDLRRRIYEHKEELIEGFSKRYHTHKLVYYEVCENMYSAITREKQIKGMRRQKKIDLIVNFNPFWNDLNNSI
jgi:putative endonuclease